MAVKTARKSRLLQFGVPILFYLFVIGKCLNLKTHLSLVCKYD